MNTTDQPRAVACIRFVRRWRTASDGVWHDGGEIKTGRIIDAIEINGQRIFRKPEESGLEWIHRTASWAQDIFDTANDKDLARRALDSE